MEPQHFFYLQKQPHLFQSTNFTVLSVDVITVLSVSLVQQQEAGSQNGKAMLFNFDGALTKRDKIPNEMGLDWRVVELSVTNGAIVIHTQRLKSDPGGNL
ncbi:hypothetical protein WI618_23595, partial [Salmonella enterica subsp. enterica serovar Corvallis]